jgi:hypothetical protein
LRQHRAPMLYYRAGSKPTFDDVFR